MHCLHGKSLGKVHHQARHTRHSTALQQRHQATRLIQRHQVVMPAHMMIANEADRAIAAGTATGHIFNLGHGVLPHTDPDTITRAVEAIHVH